MNEAILFGIASAALYGITNLVARFSNRETGVIRTMLWGQVLLSVILSLAMLIHPRKFDANGVDWVILLASSLMVVGGTACLYYGLAKGRVAVVAPVMACYGAVGAILSFLTGEELTIGAGAGLGLAAVGAVLAASPSADARKNSADRPSGWLPAVGAAVLYGAAYWIQGKYALPIFGALGVIWVHYLFATIIVAAVAIIGRKPLRVDTPKDLVLVFTTALLAAGGYLALAFGQAAGSIAVATALSAGASAITVVLAWVFTREKATVLGGLGVLCVVAGVATLHLTTG
jgi:drug/metabolite transporter (DMT)-like permease